MPRPGDDSQPVAQSSTNHEEAYDINDNTDRVANHAQRQNMLDANPQGDLGNVHTTP